MARRSTIRESRATWASFAAGATRRVSWSWIACADGAVSAGVPSRLDSLCARAALCRAMRRRSRLATIRRAVSGSSVRLLLMPPRRPISEKYDLSDFTR
jgi:hypothetical protein